MRPLLFILAALVSGCRTSTVTSPAGGSTAYLTRTQPVQAWELVENAVRIGSIVRYEHASDSSKAYFGVKNAAGQTLGIVDVEGRIWRYRPHERDPEWLGTGTVLEGARAILGAGARAELFEISLASLAENPAGTAAQ